MEGTTTTFIADRSPEEVFDLVSDLARAPEWVPDLVSVEQLTPGPLAVGTRFAEKVMMGGKEGDAELKVTELDVPRIFAHEGAGGPASFSTRFEFEAKDGGTQLTQHFTLELSGMFKFMAPMLNGWVRKNSDAAMENLQRLLSGD